MVNEKEIKKKLGAFYTPSEIANFMCKEALIYYLAGHLEDKVKIEDIERFIKNGEISNSIIQNAEIIDSYLSEITICEPAVGEGVFLVEMLKEITKARKSLLPFTGKNLSEFDIKRHCIENSFYGVDIDQRAVETTKSHLYNLLIENGKKN